MIVRSRSGAALRLALLAAAGVCVTACGGGGGGGGGPVLPTPSTPTTPTTPTTPVDPRGTTNPSLPLNPPSVSSGEYRRSYVLGAIHADTAYALGATGKGITVAVIDTGYDPSGADMQGAYSSASTDIISSRNTPVATERHGVEIAGIIGARFNGRGTIGVAYESTILSVRADQVPAAGCTSECDGFLETDSARAIDYAVANGARVINLSFGGEDASSNTFRAAVQRAIAAGVVFTASAGNEGDALDHWPAHLAAENGFVGSLLSIGSTKADGGMSSFSNKAGSSAVGYLTAPGEDLITDCDAAQSCWRVSGTSFSSPVVAGALALLLQYFPNLSGRDAVSILLKTADDRGDAGVDSVWGNGALNLAKAFAPVGSQTLALPGGASLDLPAASTPGTMLGAAFGDAVLSSAGLTTVIHDDYNRLFSVDLAQGYRSSQRPSTVASTVPPVNDTAQTLALPSGGRLTLAAEAAMFPYAEGDASPVRTFLRPEAPSSASASVQIGGFGFTAWRGQGQVSPPQGLGGRNAFHSLAQSNSTVAGVWRTGALAFSGEGGWSERRTPLSMTPVEGSSYASATAAYQGPGFALSVSAGRLAEPRGALGSELDPNSPLALAAHTRFAAVGFDRPLGPLSLRAEASVGRTEGGGRLVNVENAVASSWRLALSGTCDAAMPCTRFGVELAQPLRVERGLFRAILADMPASYDDPITFSERRISAAPSSREVDLRFNVERPLGLGALRLEAAAAFNPAHQTAKTDLGVSAMWRASF